MPNWKKVIVSGSDAALNNITATGDVNVQGDLIAERYIISSSVSHITQSFSSGSTIFGDTLDDTHQFTGSLFISGNLTLNDGDVTINGVGPLTGLTSSYISSSFNNNIIDFFKASGVNDQIDLSSIINASGDDDWHIASANLLTSSYNVEISGTLGVSESISTPDLNLLGDGSPEIIADGVLTLSSSQTVVVSSSALIVENGIVADSITASISSSNIEGNLFLFTDGTSQGDITFNENNITSGITVIASASGLRTTDNVTFNNITASNIIYAVGNISSSGNLYGNDKLYLYDKAILNYTPNIFKIGLGTDNSQGYQRVEIGHSTIPITASGDILASENVRIEGQTTTAGISASGFLHANLQEDSAGSYNNTIVYDTNSGRFFYTGSYGSGISLDSLNNFTGSIQTEVDNLTNVTGSYAVTASNTFTDNQTIQGNITASGNISASGLLFASTSDASGQPYLNVLINTSSGQFYYTSSITTNNSNTNTINNLKVQGNPIWKVTESVVTSYNDLTGSGITLDEGDLLFTNSVGGTYYAVLRTVDYTGKNHDNQPYWINNNINAYLKYTETSSGAFKRRKINSANEPERYTIGVATPPNARIIFNLGSNPGIGAGDIAGGIVSGSISVGDIVTVDLDKNDNVNLLYTPNVVNQNFYYGPNGLLGANSDWNYIDLITGTNDGSTFLGINPATAITGGASFDLKQTGYSLQPVISRSADLELREITASLLSASSIHGILQTAAQPNITSLGTLTSLTVDNITINESNIISVTDSNVSLILNNDGIFFESNNADKFQFNQNENNVDFQLYGTSDPNLIYGDASEDKVGIGTSTPGEKLEVIGNISASGIISASNIHGNYLTLTEGAYIDSFVEFTAQSGLTNFRLDYDAGGLTINENGESDPNTIFGFGSVRFYPSITASSDISASGLLFASLSEDTAGSHNNTVVYDTTTGQLYYTGSYGSGGGGSGTVTEVTVGTGLDVINGTTTPNVSLNLTEITLSSGLDSTATGLSLDLTEVISNDVSDRFLTTNGNGTLSAETGISSFDGRTIEFNVGDASQGAFGLYTDLVNDIEPTSGVDIFIGDIVDLGSTTSTTKGKVYNLSGSWGLADADDEEKSSYLLGIATATGTSNNRFMLKGYCSIPSSFFSNDSGIVVGSPIYLDSSTGGTAGQYDFNPPSAGDTSRIVGHLVDIYGVSARGAWYKIYFNPSSEWIVL